METPMSDTPDTQAAGLLSAADQALAGLPEHTNDLAKFQGQYGYWVQAEAKFIPCSNPSTAITYYRQRLNAGDIAVDHNLGTACVGRMKLVAGHAAYKAEVAAVLRGLLTDESIFPKLPPNDRIAAYLRNTQVHNAARALGLTL
jgi:hypothetical protein